MTRQTPSLSHIHRFVDGDRAHPLLLLHGTGGDEDDLVPLGEAVAPGTALLSPRGQVREGSANRFFRRLAEGVFDLADLEARTQALADFVAEGRRAYGLGAPVALGFSNGANIAAALLLRRPEALAGAVLLRAMVPFEPQNAPDLSGKPVLILSGAADPIIPAENARRLAEILTGAGAAVTHQVLPAGHGLTREDLTRTTAWLRGLAG
ncbi:alpha/beta hydrolase [Labrys wisconsinensis]|uniref:Phospholipase/carboxylesterase n=1 Tax=Labrys wisconsinensis TaxID=425677 RepID=A0ABU0JJH6_9HYPH|nr:alpha/beta hydrolase [Labrys wisconsinensis]MDQ0474409.1 phospholipase/carboxylesterase [Labrys wisconsinensis]